jgi:large subunit ribosomal protein L24
VRPLNIRKDDQVEVLAGKDRGKRGVVERVERTKRGLGVVVPGINMAKRHQRPRSRTQTAGIIDMPVPLHVSNVQVVCPRCDKPTRVSHQLLEDGSHVRVCKHCGEQIEGAGK